MIQKSFLIKALSKISVINLRICIQQEGLDLLLKSSFKDKNNWLLNTTTLIRKTYIIRTRLPIIGKTDFDNLNVPIMEYNIQFNDNGLQHTLRI
jgi:hypothetical protein